MPQGITKLPNLRSLSLQQCGKLNKLPEIWPEGRLEQLHIDQAPLRALPTQLGFAMRTTLVTLELKHVALASLPPEIGQLQVLEVLTIVGMSWQDDLLARHNSPGFHNKLNLDELRRAQQDQALKIANTDSFYVKAISADDLKIVYHAALKSVQSTESSGSMPDSALPCFSAQLFGNVPRLGLGATTAEAESDDSDTVASGFPLCITRLINLRNLKLTFHAFRTAPRSLANLIHLEQLDLSHNPLLETLPGQLGTMKSLKKVSLRRCPSLKTPPSEVVKRGNEAIVSYLKYLSSDQVECRRTKLMLVGLGGAGKTSLLRALKSDTNKTQAATTEEITDGIDITDWTVGLPDGRHIQYSTWDFAGQVVYYNTHQFFMSKRAVYLLLWTVRLGFEHAGLDFWLSSIMCHAPGAPVFVVGTHCDQVAKYEIPVEQLRKRYPQVSRDKFFIFYRTFFCQSQSQCVHFSDSGLSLCELHHKFGSKRIA